MTHKTMDQIIAESRKALRPKKKMKPPQKGGKPKKIKTTEPKRPRADGTTR